MATVQRLLMAGTLLLTASACAPTTGQPNRPVEVQVEVDTTAVAYHPTQAGILRTYTTEQGGSEIHQEHLGRTVRSGVPYQVVQTRGGGRDTRSYHRHTTAGVFKAIETTPNYEATYDPPMQMLPGTLQVGQTWQGSSTVTFTRQGQPPQHVDVHYQSRVIDQRQGSISGQEYNFFVIQTEGFDENGAPVARQERWYVPHLGDVKPTDGLLLVASNLPGTQ